MIEAYLKAKSQYWSKSTLRSETYRLVFLKDKLHLSSEELYKEASKRYNPYALVTFWTRVRDYGKFNKIEKYEQFYKENKFLFKNKYIKTVPNIDYETAKEKINAIKEEDIRKACISLLKSGLRIHELSKINNGIIKGKGNKTRLVYSEISPIEIPYHRIYKALRSIGLKPHDLRKLCLSKLVELGVNEFELCEIAGWSNLTTASSYIRINKNKIKKFIEAL